MTLDVASAVGPKVAIAVLGGFEVRVDGRRLTRADWQRAAAERLVKLLLVTPGHRVQREIAADTLWPDAGPEAGRASLRKALHYAHLALRGSDLLVELDGAPALDPARLDLDLDRLHAAFDRIGGPGGLRRVAPPSRADRGVGAGHWAAGESAAAVEIAGASGRDDGTVDAAIDTVLELGPRELLPDDRFEDWLLVPREQLRSRWQRIALQAGEQAAERGRAEVALQLAEQLLEHDPTDEAAHRLAIRVYAAAGRHHAARRQLELCRQALRDGLDADVSEATVRAFEESARPAAGGDPQPARPRLVGRRRELEEVELLLDEVAAGRLASLVIRGPAGIGKTRLLDEVAALGRAGGWRVVQWRAVDSTSALAYAPLRVGLALAIDGAGLDQLEEPGRSAAAALVPALGDEPHLRFEAPDAFVAALVSLVERLARGRPSLLAVDDLPSLDAASLAFLGTLVSGLADAPLLVAATYRDDEPGPPAVAGFLDHVRRSGGVELSLGPLDERDIEGLVTAHLGGRTVQPALARAVHARGLGNPLFCLEVVRAGRDRGSVRLADGRWATTVGGRPSTADELLGADAPATVRALVAARSAALPAAARDVLAIAAELGPRADFDTLAAILPGDHEPLLDALDEALASGLLVEDGAGYAFAHPLYRLAFRGAAGARRRGTTCLRIACALGAIGRPDMPAADLERAAAASLDPAPVAAQALAAWDLGVREAGPVAVAFGFQAARRAVRLLDREGAEVLLERSLGVWRVLPAASAGAFAASGALVLLADLHTRAGREEQAAAACAEAVRAARAPEELANAYAAWFWLPYQHGDFEAARGLLEEGLARIPATELAARARLETFVGWCLVRTHRFDEAETWLRGAVACLDAAGDARGTMQALDFLGVLLRYQHRHEEGIGCLERSLALALELGDDKGERTARIHLVPALVQSGLPHRARPHAERALELGSQTGDRYAEAVASWVAADRAAAVGDLEGAIALRRRELALLASIGGNAHNEALSHAHIAHCSRLLGDEAVFAEESAIAVRLARMSPDAGYAARLTSALDTGDWTAFLA